MDDRVDAVAVEDAPDQPLIADIALDQGGALWNRPGDAGGQIIEDDHRLAGVQQLECHMAADVSGSSGHENAHFLILARRCVVGRAAVQLQVAQPSGISTTANAYARLMTCANLVAM